MFARRIANVSLIAAGAGGLWVVLAWAIGRHAEVDPAAAGFGLVVFAALVGATFGSSLHPRLSPVESATAALVATAFLAATTRAIPAVSIGGDARGLVTAAAVALACGVLGARSRTSRARPRFFAGALAFIGVEMVILALCVLVGALDNQPVIALLAAFMLIGSPFFAGVVLGATLGARAYRAASRGAALLCANAFVVIPLAERGERLHAGELAAIGVLLAGVSAVIWGIAHHGVDCAIGWGWGEVADSDAGDDGVESASLPRAEVTSAPDRRGRA